jgi:alkanesulfonate monooxygenase SsuD/methylene tetrahydromethanopterin reductase-like flavin-dependent oxidoreductase (luciferase family)
MIQAPAEFGIGFYNTQSTYVRPRRHPYLFREAAAEARRAEELGFDSFWTGEHHFSYDGYTPATVPYLAHIAAATERIEVGAGVMLFPLRTAEEVARQCQAFSDALPDRTLRLAMAVGYSAMEFAAHRVAINERGKIIERLLDELIGALGDRFGSTELWMGGTVDRVFKRAGRYGASLILGENIGPDRLREIREIWEAELPSDAHRPRIILHREVWADHDKATLEYVRRRLYESWKVYDIYFEDPKPWEMLEGLDRESWLDAMMGLSVLGSPDHVVDHLGQLIEAGADGIVFRVRYDGTTHGQATGNLERISRDVIPQLKEIAMEVAR